MTRQIHSEPWFTTVKPFWFIIGLILAGASSLLLVALIYSNYFPTISTEHPAWGEFGSYFGGVGGTIIAALALAALAVTARLQAAQLTLERERHKADSLIQEMQENYKRAFEALYTGGEDGLPNNSRLSWLTAARLILVANELSEKTPLDYEEVRDSTELYWRYRFFHLLEPLDRVGENFWADGVENLVGWKPGEREPISEKSAKVIHDWIYGQWQDPMEGQERFSDEQIEKLVSFR